MSKIENTSVPNPAGNQYDPYSPIKAENITFLQATEDFRPTGTQNGDSRWQDISSEIWQNQMDQVSSTKDQVAPKFEQIKTADELNHPLLLAGFQRGVEDKIDLDLNSARVANRQDPLSNLIRNAQQLQDHLNWDKYQDYLSPATSRATTGVALIGTGQVAAGEKLLLEAVSRRPELQFSREFQTELLAGYEKMSRTTSTRYTEVPALPPKRATIPADEGNTGAAAQLSLGFETANKLGIKNATDLFDKAIRESDKTNSDSLLDLRMETFRDRLVLDRTIIQENAAGHNSTKLYEQRSQAADKEWNAYQRYMEPAQVRSEIAFAYIRSGDTELLARGQALLKEAVKLRPELEFTESFNRQKQQAYKEHFEKHNGSDVAVKAPDKVPAVETKVVPTAEEKPASDSPVSKPDAAAETADPTKGFTDSDLKKLAQNALVGVVLAGAGYKLIQRGAKWAFERMNATKDSTAETKLPGETEPVETKDTKTDPKIETEKRVSELTESLKQSEELRRTEAERTASERTAAEQREAKLKTELGEAGAKLSDTETKLTDTEAKLAGTETKLADTEAKLAGTETKLADTEGKLAGTEVKLNDEEKARTDSDTRNAELTKALELAKQENLSISESAKATTAEQTKTIADLTSALETAQQDKLGADEKLAAEKVAHEQKVAEFNSQLADKQAELDKATEQNTADKAKLDQELRDLHTTFDQYKESQRLAAEQRATEISEMETRVTDLSTQLEQAQTAKAESTEKLTKQLDASNSKILELEAALQKSKSEETSSKEKVSELETTLADTQRERTAAEQREAKLKTELGEAGAKLTDTETKLTDTEAKLAGTETKLADTEGKLAGTEVKLNDAEKARTDSDTRNAELTKALELAKQENLSISESAKATTAQQTKTITDLTSALETAQQDKLGADEKLAAEKLAHEQKVAEFNSQLADKQAELDKVTEQNTADKAKLDQELRDLRSTFDQYKESQRLAAEQRATEISAMETRISDLSTQLERAQTAKAESTEKLTKQLDASNSKVLELEAALQKSETEGASSKEKIAELETTLAATQREQKDSDSQLKAAQKRQAELEQQIRDMQAAREADAAKAALDKSESQQRENALKERLQQTETERDSAGTEKTEAQAREARLEERLRLAESEIRASGRRVEDLKQRLAEQRSYTNENINRPRAETRVVPPPAVDEIPIETSPFQNAQGDSSPQLQRPEAAMEQAKRVEIQLPGGLVAKVAKRDVPRMLNTMERELGIEDIAKIFETAANDSTKTSEERAKWQQVRDHFKSLDAVAQEETKIELFNRLRADLGVPVKSEATTAGRGARFLNGGGVTLGVGIIAAAILHSTLSKANTSPQSAPVQVQFSGG